MSSTLQKETEHKLTVALLDARRLALQTMNGKSEDDLYGDFIEKVEEFRKAFAKHDLSTERKVSTRLISILLNYQVKFL